MGYRQRCSKRRQQLVIDIVEYLWHRSKGPDSRLRVTDDCN